jgi:hypothetical protein
MQKRRLLNFVVSNSTWANGELNANLREPFGFIAKMAKFTSGGGSSNRADFADHSGWLRARISNCLASKASCAPFRQRKILLRVQCRLDGTFVGMGVDFTTRP